MAIGLCMGIPFREVYSNRGIPFASSALFWLDGTLSGNEFVDKTGNGRNFTITNKDFTAEYFPYKSAATISAPVGDATLFAADVNSFLYGVDADSPNEIPVVSFFQNIDYEDTIFSRHIAQTLNANGVETREPHVKDIAMYPAALTGSDLTTANSYYRVPVADVNGVWSDAVNGDDGTGDGSFGNPYKTFRVSYLAAFTPEYPVYLKTGEYVRGGTLSLFLEVKGTGLTAFKDSTGPVILTGSTNQKYEGLIIDGDSTANYGIQTGGNGTEVTRCKVQNVTSYQYYSGFGITGNVIKNSIFGFSFLRGTDTTIDTCYYNSTLRTLAGNADATKRTLIINHSKLNVDLTAQSATSRQLFELRGNLAISILDNSIVTSVIRGFFGRQTSGTNNDNQLTFSNNTCVDSLNETDLTYLQIAEGTYQRFTTIQINSNTFTMNDDILYSAIRIEGNDVANIYDNIIATNGTTNGGGVNVLSVNTSVNIYNNRIDMVEGAGAIIVGDETIQYTFDCSVYNNRVIGPREQADYASSAHAIFIKRVPDAKVYYNFIRGFNLGVVRKGQGDANTTGYNNYNRVENCGGGLLSKGQKDLLFYGNTVINDGTYPSTLGFYGGQVVNSDGGVGEMASGCIFKNNIIDDIAEYSGGAEGWAFVVADAESEVDIEIDYSNAYTVNGVYLDYKGADQTLTQAQALGYGTNDVTGDPLLTDGVPQSGSPAIGAGETLAAAYDDGLDASIDWGTASTVPVVVTKQQTAPWDVGAYVS